VGSVERRPDDEKGGKRNGETALKSSFPVSAFFGLTWLMEPLRENLAKCFSL